MATKRDTRDYKDVDEIGIEVDYDGRPIDGQGFVRPVRRQLSNPNLNELLDSPRQWG
jgi:hypothetical protein